MLDLTTNVHFKFIIIFKHFSYHTRYSKTLGKGIKSRKSRYRLICKWKAFTASGLFLKSPYSVQAFKSCDKSSNFTKGPVLVNISR